jgi:hypothetical protein
MGQGAWVYRDYDGELVSLGGIVKRQLGDGLLTTRKSHRQGLRPCRCHPILDAIFLGVAKPLRGG